MLLSKVLTFKSQQEGASQPSHPVLVRKWEWDGLGTSKPVCTGREERGKRERKGK